MTLTCDLEKWLKSGSTTHNLTQIWMQRSEHLLSHDMHGWVMGCRRSQDETIIFLQPLDTGNIIHIYKCYNSSVSSLSVHATRSSTSCSHGSGACCSFLWESSCSSSRVTETAEKERKAKVVGRAKENTCYFEQVSFRLTTQINLPQNFLHQFYSLDYMKYHNNNWMLRWKQGGGERERFSLSAFLRTQDIRVHIVHISRLIITYTSE